MDTNETRSSAPAAQLISRRSVVRAGATAAWTVPLVQVVSAAPAFAAQSPATTTLTISDFRGAYTSATNINVKCTVNNTGTSPTSGLQVSLRLPVAASNTPVAAGWDVTPPSASPGTDYVFTAKDSVAATSNLVIDADFSVTSGAGGPLSASATATNVVDAAPGTGSVPFSSYVSNLSFVANSFKAKYQTTDASKLDVSATIAHTGIIATSALAVSFKVPGNMYGKQPDAGTPSSSSSPGWVAQPVSGDSTNGWILTYKSDQQLVGVTSKDIAVTIILNDDKDSVKYAGTTFDLGGSVSGGGSDTASAKVDAASASTGAAVNVATGTNNKAMTVSCNVKNNGPKMVSALSVTVNLAKAMANSTSPQGWTPEAGSTTRTSWKFNRSESLKPGALSASFSTTFTDNGSNAASPTVVGSAS